MADEKFWTKEDVYDREIAPLMTKIIAICKEHQIPVVANFQYDNDAENGPGHCVTALVPAGRSSEQMEILLEMVRPDRHVMLAETTTTREDGTRHISIRRVT